uniref:Uncharacterized protein n=1 Tax=Arundo donax TaxID=35708 RepID=A0A0A8XRC8_ARUDO
MRIHWGNKSIIIDSLGNKTLQVAMWKKGCFWHYPSHVIIMYSHELYPCRMHILCRRIASQRNKL